MHAVKCSGFLFALTIEALLLVSCSDASDNGFAHGLDDLVGGQAHQAYSGPLRVSGVVRDQTGKPLAGAHVQVVAVADGDAALANLVTAADGAYEANLAHAGTGYLVAAANGYERQEQFGLRWSHARMTQDLTLTAAVAPRASWVGLRQSHYGATQPFDTPYPTPDSWADALTHYASRVAEAAPLAILLVGGVDAMTFDGEHVPDCTSSTPHGAILWFEGESSDPLIRFVPKPDLDLHAVLDAYDARGIQAFLQVENGCAPMEELIDIVLDEFGRHPSVVGFGVDVEWYGDFVDGDAANGIPVTDAVAEAWERRVKGHNHQGTSYQLFLKHFAPKHYASAGDHEGPLDGPPSSPEYMLPPHYTRDIVFVNDSQDLTYWAGWQDGTDPELAFQIEMGHWANEFAPNDVLFQVGYETDEWWWSRLETFAKEAPEVLAERLFHNDTADAFTRAVNGQRLGVAWVDFTMRSTRAFRDRLNPPAFSPFCGHGYVEVRGTVQIERDSGKRGAFAGNYFEPVAGAQVTVRSAARLGFGRPHRATSITGADGSYAITLPNCGYELGLVTARFGATTLVRTNRSFSEGYVYGEPFTLRLQDQGLPEE
jgi:hypothetical protein